MNCVEPIRDLKKIEEIEAYLREQESPRNYLLFVLGLNFALRVSDLLSLKVKDVRFENGNLRAKVYVKESKTGKEKIIYINEASREALNFYFSEVEAKQDDWLFPSTTYECPINRSWVWKLFNQWTRKVGLEGRYGTHSWRKSWGYQARQKGVPIELIQAKFQHSSPAVTKRYIGISDDEVAQIEMGVNL